MAHFIYKAKKSSGEIYKGERDANDRFDLYKILKQSGEEVIEVKEKRGVNLVSKSNLNISLPFLNQIKAQEKINFARNLGSMITAGLSMSRALTVIERQSKNKKFKKVVNDIQENITKGKTLSESMAAHQNVFSPIFISMVSAGERSGTLNESLKITADQLDKNYSLQRKVKGAMMYPAIILFAMAIIAVLMLTYIVPTLMKTFTDLKLSLPNSTKFIIFVSQLMINDGIWVLLLVVSFISALVFWSRRDSGKKVIHYLILQIPIIGNIIKEVNSARTARTLSSLLSSGVDVIESVKITKDVVQNIYYRNILDKVGVAIEKGEPISKIFNENNKFYPIFLGEMINVGEETGKIGEMLNGVAVFYEEDVEQKTKDMSTIIEPFLMIIIAAVVGFFAVAMISPMYSLVNVI